MDPVILHRMREILTDPMELGKVVLEEKKSIKKMKMEKVLAQS